MSYRQHINREYIIDAFTDLGRLLDCAPDENALLYSRFELAAGFQPALADNPWFTEAGILRAIRAIVAEMLDEKLLRDWAQPYACVEHPHRVGVIMAGNIPLVGYHDILATLVAGHIAVVKPSSKDRYLISVLCRTLVARFPLLNDRIVFADRPQDIARLIASGSDNSARYFRAEYKNIPLLLRQSRYSLAVLDGTETDAQLDALADDIFSYFGLGCRNVSNILVPQNYDLNRLVPCLNRYANLRRHTGYNNCFRYRKALAELSGEEYVVADSLVMRRHQPAFAGVAMLNYSEYRDVAQIKTLLADRAEKIQCVVGACPGAIPFGTAQQPSLNDYADGVDTMRFLTD
jgi:hypothetical protein